MELETKYALSKDKAAAIIYRAAYLGYPIEGTIWKKDTYYDKEGDDSSNKKFRLREEQILKSRSNKDSTNDNTRNAITRFFDDSLLMDENEKKINALVFDSIECHYLYTYKEKQTIDGFEQNIEKEAELDDTGKDALLELFNYTGMKPYFSKEKKTFGIFADNYKYHIEIVNFRGHFWAEIEYTSDDGDKYNIMRNIETIATSLDIPLDNKDNRSWKEIGQSLDNE